MFALVILGVSVAPVIFWLWYFYKKDRWEPEPKRQVLRVFFWGAIVAFPVALLEAPFAAAEFLVVVVAPIIEESAKYWVVYRSVYRHAEFDEPFDGILYAAASALGFAAVENIVYVAQAYSGTSPLQAVATVVVARALLSVPGHVLFSSMWGYALGWAKFTPNRAKARYLAVRGLVVGIVLHGLFNFLAVTALFGAFGVLTLMFLMWRLLHRRIHHLMARSPHRLLR